MVGVELYQNASVRRREKTWQKAVENKRCEYFSGGGEGKITPKGKVVNT